MKTPPLLLGIGLLLWGAVSGQWLVAALLAVSIEGLRFRPIVLSFDHADRNRITDLCALLSLAVGGYYVATAGLPGGLLSGVSWFPLTLAPLVLVQVCSDQPFRVSNVFYSLRRSKRAEAMQEIDLLPIYFAMLLLVAASIAQRALPVFLGMLGVVGLWLYTAARRRPALWPFLVGLLVASGLAFAVGEGLYRLQTRLEDWVLNNMSGGDSDTSQSQTRLGALGKIKQDEGIVWRIRASAPPTLPLLIRDGVYTRFDGHNWMAHQSAFQVQHAANGGVALLDELPAQGLRLAYTGDATQGQALLALPAAAYRLEGAPGVIEKNAAGLVKLHDVPTLMRFSVDYTALPPAGASSALDLLLTRRDRELVDKVKAASARLADPALPTRPASQRVAAVRAFFAEGFRYTLFLGDETTGARDLQRFLLQDKAGHCEYFGTASVLLLRSLGVPARYVTGFSVQEYSRLERAFIVRNRHAHAWAEAYVDGRWMAVDTTPAEWAGAEEQQAPAWQPVLDFASWVWLHFKEWRADDSPYPPWLPWLLGGGLIVWLGRDLRLRRRDSAAMLSVPLASQSGSAYMEFERRLTKLGHPRAPAETPRGWLERLRREGCVALGEVADGEVDALVGAHYQRAYG